MIEEDKATTLIPDTPVQELIKKTDRQVGRAVYFSVAILVLLTIFNVVTAVRLQTVINQNQKDALTARQANIDRQGELKDYVKCVLLISFDVPKDQLTTRQGTEKALDHCATGDGNK